MSSFNVFTSRTRVAGKSTPVWLGVVSPRPVGGTLAEAFRKAGMLIPAGTPVHYDEANRVITPFAAWKVVSVNTSTHAVTVKANEFGVLPAANDYLGIVGTTFAATGAAGKVSSVAADATAGQYVITMTDAKLDGATAGQYLAFSSADAVAASGKSLANQPNAYLYNDIAIDPEVPGVTDGTIKASGAVVDFHGEGILINRTPAAAFAALMKVAVPNVVQVGF